ncbi:MAG: GLPGLI family protein, partial [Muribaculaceae bacterium]|nr:GLPGLI family protein [Muribaculaceae bacterium]
MKKIIFLLSILLGAMCAKAEKSDLVVSYDYVSPTIVGQLLHHPMLLLSSQEQSKFFNQESEYVDSLNSTPKGEAIYKQMLRAAYERGEMSAVPMRKSPMYIFRSKKDNKIKEYDDFAWDSWVYEESFEPQEWEIIPDSTKTILGYECIKAVCDYHGRHWTAWFAPEIPVSDGPWKLCGLPVLILGAEESEGK